MRKPKVLIAGCGDVGTALGLLLIDQGYEVYGLRRTINQLPDSIHAIKGDLIDKSSLSALADLPVLDYLVYSAAGGGRGAAAYQGTYIDGFSNVMQSLTHAPKHTFFTSSTSVYGQSNGEWVDETSPTEPNSETGKIMVAAEQQVLTQRNSTVVRFSGIYGPGRDHLIRTVQEGIIAPPEPLHYSNRIHRDDCAGVLAHLIGLVEQGQAIEPIYLASDDAPTPIHEVMKWLAQQRGIEIKGYKEIRRGGSKRCRNEKLKRLSYQLKAPSFVDGYVAPQSHR
ncbi:SDR family oxidoreductase [Neptunomonas phycophila]|uniref:SDR family oxidoreductase n=1 Tax=Neptunomonas phycophila TaxID=1572645 RepID=UPI0030F55C96